MGRWGIVVATLLAGSACDGPSGSSDGGTDGGGSTGTLIVAVQGGEVTSSDGIFTLVIPPGSISEDLTFSVTALARSAWPSDLDEQTVLTTIYEVQPSGTVFDPPATGIWSFPSAPPGLLTPDGVARLGVEMRDGSTITSSPEGGLWFLSDGRVSLEASITHLSNAVVRHDVETGLVIRDRFHLHDVQANPDREEVVGAGWSAAERRAPTLVRLTEGGVVWNSGGWAAFSTDTSVAVITGPGSWPLGESLSAFRGTETSGEWPNFPARLGPPHETLDVGEPAIEIPLSPLPSWQCIANGDADYGTVFIAVTGRLGPGFFEVLRLGWVDRAEVRCGSGTPPRQPTGEAVLGVVQPVTVADGTVTPSGPESIVVELGAYPDSILDELTPFVDGNFLWEGVDRFSTRDDSPPVVDITTSTQNITATLTGDTYVFSGADASQPAFDLTDTVTWSSSATGLATVPTDSDRSIEVDVPGDGTVLLSVADGTWQAISVVGELGGSALAGEAGFRMLVDTDTLPLVDGRRELAPFSPTFLDALDARGLSITGNVLFGAVNRVYDETIFPGTGPIAFIAGRFVSLDSAQLITPPPGGAIVRDCSELPGTYTPIDPAGTDPRIAMVCIDEADAYCFVTNDPFEDTPPTSGQCVGNELALRISPNRTTGEPMACIPGDGSWIPVWSSRGYYSPSGCMEGGAAIGVEQFFEVQRPADGTRRRVRFRTTGPGVVEVLGVETDPVGPYPPFAALHSCRESPITFPAAAEVTDPHATIYLDNSGTCVPCMLRGDAASTPEVETVCPNTAAFELYYSESGTRAARLTTATGSRAWSIESASAGTTVPPRSVVDYPADTDVTVVVTNGTQRWQIVFRHTSANAYVVSSVARL